MLHTSALMYIFLIRRTLRESDRISRLDDIEDGSKLRRGMPSAQMSYGESQTINSATCVSMCAFAEAAKLLNPGSMSIVCGWLERDWSPPCLLILSLFWMKSQTCTLDGL